MKARFRKIHLLAHHSDQETLTSALQDLGVVHLELDTQFRNELLEDLELQKNNLAKAIDFIKKHADHKNQVSASYDEEDLPVSSIVDQVLESKHLRESIFHEEEVLRKDKLRLLPWKGIDLDRLRSLTASNVNVQFCVVEKRAFREKDLQGATFSIVHEEADRLYVVIFSIDPLSDQFETVELPSMSMSEIEKAEKRLIQRKKELAETIHSYSHYLPGFLEEKVRLDDQFMLLTANGSYKQYGEGSIAYLKGWFPATMEERLIHFMKRDNYSFAITEPTAQDRVPVLLENPKYPKLFESITRIFQMPGYYEMDLTPFIAVFYPILFAYCLGDAGYGMILLLVAMLGWFTFFKKLRKVATLGMILGIFTTFMGVVKSGSIFGMPIIKEASSPLMSYLHQFVFIPDNSDVVFNAFNVALMIGVVQIIVGIIISIANKVIYENMVAALPRIGKLMMVSSLIWMFLADMQEMEILQPLPGLRKGLLLSGVLMVLLFHDMSLSWARRAANGILPVFFIFTGVLGDVLSYVRLFALGVASSVLGLVVNQIGSQIMTGSWWALLLGVIFLIAGHSLNFALAALGAFVHPLRLTFVEFYNNAQFEGGGVIYKPLRKMNIITK